jgi:hypothetical protein
MLNKVANIHFQNLSHLTDYNSLIGCNRFYVSKSGHYEILRYETIAEIDAVRRFIS